MGVFEPKIMKFSALFRHFLDFLLDQSEIEVLLKLRKVLCKT